MANEQGIHNQYRPTTFDEVIGNEKAVTILKGIISKGKFPSGILFVGPPGVGKTTLARVFVNEVNGVENFKTNCEEINFGANRSIEEIRDLIRISKLRPSNGAKRRFLLGDEAQQLLTNAPAANAILKPLEEPVSTTTFLFGTMEPDKFTSSTTGRAFTRRCLTIVLQKPTDADVRKQALRIIRGENLKEYLDKDTITSLVTMSNGSMSELANNIEMLGNFLAGLAKKRALTVDDLSEVLSGGNNSDDVIAVRMLMAVYDRKYVAAHREILDVQDSFGFINKCLWLNWFVMNQVLLKGARHPKIWGTAHGWNLFKEFQGLMGDTITREQQITIVAEVNAGLANLKTGSGAFAVDEKIAMSTMVWGLISRLKVKVKV